MEETAKGHPEVGWAPIGFAVMATPLLWSWNTCSKLIALLPFVTIAPNKEAEGRKSAMHERVTASIGAGFCPQAVF